MSSALTKTKAIESAPALPLPLGQSIIDAEKRSQAVFGQALQSIAAVQRSSAAARQADDAGIIELEKSCALEKARADAAETSAKAKVEAADSRVKALTELVSVMQGQLKEQAAQLAALQKSHVAFVQRYNTHQHSHVCEGQGLGTAHTSAPGLKRYAGRQGCLFDSHGFPVPNFDDNKKA